MSQKKHLFLRLLSYVKPYWFRLTIGLVAGLLVGGSLFVSLMMLPQLVGTVSVAGASGVHQEQRVESVSGADAVLAKDPQLAKILEQAQDAAVKFRLPFSINGTEVSVHWPKEFSFSAVSEIGTKRCLLPLPKT